MKQLLLSIIIFAIGNIITTATATSNENDARKLDQDEPIIHFAGQSIVFDQCFDSRNVVYRACLSIYNDDDDNAPSVEISDECDEYIVDMQTYLDITLNYKREKQQRYCEECECYEDDALEEKCNLNSSYLNCADECSNIENMEEYGYLDASEFVECQELEVENSSQGYYTGAACTHNGNRIKIGVFSDEECLTQDRDASINIDNYLKNEDGHSMKLSYHLLKQTWSESEPLTTCLRDDSLVNPTHDEQLNQNVCNELHDVSSKCSELPDFSQPPGSDISITMNSNLMICRQDEEPVTEGEEIETEEEESATSGHNDSQLEEEEEEEEEEEGTDGDDAYTGEEEEPLWAKFHSFSIKFDRCHLDDFGQSYVVFRAYDSTSDCSADKYDEYSVYMHTYMDNALRYRKQVQKEYCSTCTDEDCEQECDTLISNLLLGTYLDASELIRCQELQRDIYTGDVLYVGAVCAPGGSRIEIGVFTDYQCMNHDETKNVEDYLKKKEGFSITWSQTTDSMKVSYYLLKQIYDKDECTIPCSEGEDDEDGIVLNTVCEELSVGATKCSESPDFIQFPVSEVTSIERSSNSNAKTMICGGKAEGLPPLSSLDTTSEEEDEYEGDIDEYVLGGGEDDDEEAKVGTYGDSSSTHIHVCMIVLVITSSACFMF